ncbi:uncharacterized protein LOC143200611 [Rhynchophorus ferrugineus]|uniref:Essential protein Yae1 N-terminal domain-containing protein n=1 Tax=Rhynchophorus ferrugineus TaxID=354439 RepID=A0A834MDA4_RHYFE|nr:hypothetical protein GWI33_013362 [Rhynchophorus ferrugineus]
MGQNKEDPYEIDLEWKKIEKDMIKVGLKNGLSDGRDSNFQKSFDKGYEDGFRNGFLLGKQNFIAELSKNTNPLLVNDKTAMCVVCQDEKDNNDVLSVRQKQSEVIKKHISTLNI